MKPTCIDRIRSIRAPKKDGDELDERLGLVVQDSLTGSRLLLQALFLCKCVRFTVSIRASYHLSWYGTFGRKRGKCNG